MKDMKDIVNLATRELHDIPGVITEIERYAIHDGLGIRSTVFLKGCPLACLWCSNPETQKTYVELGLFDDKCIGCGACVTACPHGAITVKGGVMETNRDLCVAKCYRKDGPFPCVLACYTGGRVELGAERTAYDVYMEIARDRAFFDSSGGGMTLSGGEPMTQPEFAYALLRICKEHWISTAMETCGAADIQDYQAILPHLDMLFIDLKGMNPDSYRKWVGAEPDRQASNVKRLAPLCKESGTAMIVRTPIIPGFNDSETEVEKMAAFLKESGVTGAELLPYHKLGRGKYAAIGRTYTLQEALPPDNETMARLNLILEKHGIEAFHF